MSTTCLRKSIRIKGIRFCGFFNSYFPVVAVLGECTAGFRYAGPTTVGIFKLTDAELLLCCSTVRRNAFIHPRPPTNDKNSRPASSFGKRRENNRETSPRSQIHDPQMSSLNFQHSNQGYTRINTPHVPGQENM